MPSLTKKFSFIFFNQTVRRVVAVVCWISFVFLCGGSQGLAAAPTSIQCQIIQPVGSNQTLNLSLVNGEVVRVTNGVSSVLFVEDAISCGGTLLGKNYCRLDDNSDAGRVTLVIEYSDSDQSFISDGGRQDLIRLSYERRTGNGLAEIWQNENPIQLNLSQCKIF